MISSWYLRLSIIVIYLASFLSFSSNLAIYNRPDSLLDCAGSCNNQRYNIIRLFLNNYQRPFTVLDIGSDKGGSSLRIARDYDAVCVMTGANKVLLKLCKAHSDLDNIILLNMHFTPEKIRHLGECEHFDVVLALNIMHEFGERWREAFDAMLGLGDFLIVEVSFNNKELEERVVAQGGRIIGQAYDNHGGYTVLYKITLSNKYLRRNIWLRSLVERSDCYGIESSFTRKQLIKAVSLKHDDFITTSWIAGINFCTFKMCYGVYPTNAQLKDSLFMLKDIEHNDWMMNNMIVQGTKLIFIDYDGPFHKRYFSEDILQGHYAMLALNDPKEVERYFWNELIHIK